MRLSIGTVIAYLAPVFLGALLLFQVQPVVARFILPWYGGTPAVWTTCMLFFQIALLVGYAYAHFISARLAPRAQAIVHCGLLVLAVGMLAVMGLGSGAPLLPSAGWKPTGDEWPVGRIILTLAVSIGLPYAVLASTSPLLQAWFHRTQPGASPYRLYALSNAGSLIGLVTYPFIIEPALTMRAQAFLWTGLFVLFAASYAYSASRVARLTEAPIADADAAVDESKTTAWQWALWLTLPALASVMLLALTNQMCQEVAVVPFLWVVPLSLYLLSFIICFDHERWYRRDVFVPILVAMVVVGLALVELREDVSVRTQVVAYSTLLFACCMVCHGELVRLRPAPRHLTSFYMAIATGGALGGVFVGLVAPFIFSSYMEVHIALGASLVVACVAILENAVWWLRATRVAYMLLAVLAVGWILGGMPGAPYYVGNPYPDTILRQRNFYGVLRVGRRDVDDAEQARHVLINGNIIHGFQYLDRERRRWATTYFSRDSGVGRAIDHHQRRDDPAGMSIGIVGLGTGTLAAYGREIDRLRFYDINPGVVDVAWNSDCFTYLSDCPTDVDVIIGDARISMERQLLEGSQQFDVLVLDAFSSDAIPAHLLTREAFGIYIEHLRRPDGILAVHVSNRVLDLKPVVRAAAQHYGLSAETIMSDGDSKGGFVSDWILLAPEPNALAAEGIADVGVSLDDVRDLRMWTDDYYSLSELMY